MGERGYGGGRKLRGPEAAHRGGHPGPAAGGGGVPCRGGDAKAAPRVAGQSGADRWQRLEVVWAGPKYHPRALNAWGAGRPDLGWRPEVVRRRPGAEGLVRLPRRWVVERTFARRGRAGRPSPPRWCGCRRCPSRPPAGRPPPANSPTGTPAGRRNGWSARPARHRGRGRPAAGAAGASTRRPCGYSYRTRLRTPGRDHEYPVGSDGEDPLSSR